MAREWPENLSMRELSAEARRFGIDSVAHMHPEELIEAIREQQEFMPVIEEERAR